MQGFRHTRRGAESRLEADERHLLARVVADVAQLLGTVLVAGPATGERPGPRADGSERAGADAPAPRSDEEVLAALDFDPAEDARQGLSVGHLDPALERLLPPASYDDPVLAAEWRRLTGAHLRAEKTERLERVFHELRDPSGAGGRVLVPAGAEGDWLATLTDVRLVLASRLGVTEEEDVDRVHRLAQGEPVEPRRRQERTEPPAPPGRADHPARRSGPAVGEVTPDPWDELADDAQWADDRDAADEQLEAALASLYTALTWWQESLLQSLGESHPPS